MGLFFPDEKEFDLPIRKGGFARYREVLEANWKAFLLVGFITLLFFIPFAAGLVYAILSTGALAALAAGVLGGMVAGPGLACMYDLILRRLRNDKADWWFCWKKAMAQNWRGALLPGAVQCGFMSMAGFAAALMLRGQTPFSWGTAVLLLFGLLLLFMIMTLWWVQLVLFTQRTLLRLKNAFFFTLFHLPKVLGAAALRVVWWLVMVLFLPWTAFVVPVLGIWYVLYLSVLILYRDLDRDFKVEEQIREAFPDSMEEDG